MHKLWKTTLFVVSLALIGCQVPGHPGSSTDSAEFRFKMEIQGREVFLEAMQGCEWQFAHTTLAQLPFWFVVSNAGITDTRVSLPYQILVEFQKGGRVVFRPLSGCLEWESSTSGPPEAYQWVISNRSGSETASWPISVGRVSN